VNRGGFDKEMRQTNNFRQPEEININFGCPARKIYKQKSGCFIMKTPQLAKKIIKAVTDNTDLPVSIKIRAGISTFEALKFLKEVADLNWTKVIVHGRTYEKGFSGKIDFEKIKKIKELFPQKTVVANGGIFSPEDALEVLEKTGVDELAIARGCLGNPWLFSQIKDLIETGQYQKPSLEEIKVVALEHALVFEKYNSAENLIAFRKHLGWYFKDFENAKQLRKELFSLETLSELKKILN
jgi:tRNA-dihydrouridine synthase B